MQSKADPLGLKLAGNVKTAGSDANSTKFSKEMLPSVTSLLNMRLSDQAPLKDGAKVLDPSKIRLKTDSDVRVYFVGESKDFSCSLGFNTDGKSVKSGNPELIFPDTSSNGDDSRNASNPIKSGDFVNLGTLKAGDLLNFFLIADGANGGKNAYSTDRSANPDGLRHAVAFAQPGSSLLIIGFENDYGKGEGKGQSLLFAVDMGASNVAALLATPEPTTYATMGTLLAGTIWFKRRQDRKHSQVAAV